MSVEGNAQILFEGVSSVTATPSVDVGTECTVAGEKYVYVYNCGGSATGVGVGMSRPTSAAAGIYSGSVSSASGDMIIGFIKHVTIPSGSYGWALKKGRVNVAVASGASTQDLGPKAIGANGLVATHAAAYFCIGELATAIVSGNSGYLLVNVP